MRWFWMVLAIVIVPLTAGAAVLPDGGVTAQEVARALQNKGFQTELSTDKEGDPLIKSTYEGAKFSVYFYECGGKPRCKSIQFASGFAMNGGIAVARVAEWNRTKRFGRVYQDNDNDPWIEMDMDMEHGGTTEALENNVDRWLLVMREFRKYIGR